MDLLNEQTYAYLAGLIDADGHITIVNRNYKRPGVKIKGYRINVHIYNCNVKIIDYLHDLLGGKMRSNNINRSHTKWRNCMAYTAQNKRATDLISRILPYLIVKKKQALIALEAHKVRKQHSSSTKRWHPELIEECNSKMATLKEEINKLNIRGTEKQFEAIDVSSVPFNIHYLAGFCDADGSILITKMGQQLAAKITFTNTDKNVIDWIQHHIGGNLYTKKRTNRKWNTSYELTFLAHKAYVLAERLYPHLLLKRKQAKLIMGLGKIKSLFNSATLRWNKELNTKSKWAQKEIRIACQALNKRSAQ